MEQLLANNNAVTLVPVVADDDDQRQTILTRGTIWCPPEIVPNVIGKILTPRQMYMTLYPILKAKVLLTECKHLLNFLCFGYTIPSTNNAPLVVHLTVGVQVIIDSSLQKYMRKFLEHNFKGLKQNPASTLLPKWQMLVNTV